MFRRQTTVACASLAALAAVGVFHVFRPEVYAYVAPVNATQGRYLESVIYRVGSGPYAQYRIPSLVTTKKGTLLAFAEGRAQTSDSGDINVLLRRSTDGGVTWTEPKVVADRGADTVGNPCGVVDAQTGFIWLLLSGNPGSLNEGQILANHPGGTRTVWVTHSEDDGLHWADLTEVTQEVKRREWTWIATGPGIGIQTRDGRLVMPANFAVTADTKTWGAFVIVSLDHGKTWQAMPGVAGPGTNESQVVELSDGTLMLNMRNHITKGHRATSISSDGGMTWSPIKVEQALLEPICEGSILRYDAMGDPGNRILFCNPFGLARQNVSIQVSTDNGSSWPVRRSIYTGPSAYSCLTRLADGDVGLLYERGATNAYEELVFAKMNLQWILGAQNGGNGDGHSATR